jgi:hypothetical protein
MPISLRSDQPAGDANVLTSAQVDANWTSLYGTPVLLTITSDTLTVTGAGTYRVLPQSGTSDNVTAIAGAQRVGDEITLLNQTVGHTITYISGTNLRLTANWVVDNDASPLVLKCVSISPMRWIEIARSYNP